MVDPGVIDHDPVKVDHRAVAVVGRGGAGRVGFPAEQVREVKLSPTLRGGGDERMVITNGCVSCTIWFMPEQSSGGYFGTNRKWDEAAHC